MCRDVARVADSENKMQTLCRAWLALPLLVLNSSCVSTQPMQVSDAAIMPADFHGVVRYVDATQVRAWQAEPIPFVVLDVRTDEEFREDGHAPGAVLASYYLGSRRRGENVNFLRFVGDNYRPEQRLLLLCSHGMRATQAAWELQAKAGFEEVYVFPGGYEGHYMEGYGSGDGWKSAGLPMVFSPAED